MKKYAHQSDRSDIIYIWSPWQKRKPYISARAAAMSQPSGWANAPHVIHGIAL